MQINFESEIYEIHTFELREDGGISEKVNDHAIMYATYAVTERKLEKIPSKQ